VDLRSSVDSPPAGSSGAGLAQLFEPTDHPNGIFVGSNQEDTYFTIVTAPGQQGTTSPGAGSWRIIPASPGTRTYSIRYSASEGETGFFKNRQLWVAVMR
jgi:hypothetical protein